jgi:hypothetical protein
MATQRVIGLYVLCILLVLFEIAIQCSSIATINTTEGFTAKKKAPPVPAYCGTHGYFNTNILNTKIVPNRRSYTQSQCDAIGGIMRNGYDCVKLKKIKQNDDGEYDFSSENIKMSYNEKCGGLNYQTTPRPSECGSVGKPNVEVKMTINGKKTTIPANSAILYTQDECENVLEGNFVNVQTVMDQQKKTRKELVALWGGSIQEFNKAIKDNGGEDMGLCNGVDNTQPNFSQACTGTAGLLGGSGAGGFFSWLTSFF